MTNPNSVNRRDLILLCIILFIAAIMRFDQPGIVEFFHDDAMLSTLAQQMASGEAFHLTGIISSVGIPNPPTSVYVMAVPFSLSPDPNFAIYFVMLLNVIGVGLLWWIAHRHFGRTVALVAGLAYAANPWAVLYSRKIWAQDFHTPFILLAIALGLYGFYESSNNKRLKLLTQVISLPILVFGMQIHFAGWLLAPLYLIILWMGRKSINWRALFASTLLTFIVLLPYLIGLTQTLESDPTRISDAASRSDINTGITFTGDAIRFTLFHITGLGMETWVAPDQQSDLLAAIAPPAPMWFLLGVFALAGIYTLSRKSLQWIFFIILWAFLPIVVFLPNWTPIYSHYFIASIPALTLLIGVGLNWLAEFMARFLPKESRVGLLVVFAAIMLTQALWWRGLLRWLDSIEIAYPGFTTPIHYLNDVRDDLKGYDDVIVISHGMAWNLHHESVVWSVMLRGQAECVRTVEGEGYAVFPYGKFAVLYTPDATENPVDNLYLTDDPTVIEVRPGGGEYAIHHFDTAPEWHTEIEPISPARFESGVQLAGYSLENSRLTLEWNLPEPVFGLDYQYSGQFLDENEERITQIDARFWHGRHWCAGDRLMTWKDAEIPSNAKTLRVSLYTLGTGINTGQFFNANVLDEMGNPAGQWVDIPLD